MKHSRYTLGDRQVSEICLKDLARRSRFGGVFYLMAFLAAAFSSAPARDLLEGIALFAGLFILLQIERLYLYRKVTVSKPINAYPLFLRYAILYNLSASVWVVSSAWLFYVNPVIDIAITANVMSAAGISIGGITVLAVSYKMLRNYWLIICLPFALAAGVFLEQPGNWIVVGLILGYGLFILMTGKQLNRSYWQALNDNLRLSEQAEELEKAKLEAEAAGQAKANFLAAMTHEIRTPLNGVLGMAQLLSLSKLNDEQQQQVAIINNAGSNLMHIINNILDYSKMNADQLELEEKQFDPTRLVEEVVQLLSSQSEKQGLKLACDFEDLPDTLLGDSYRLHQILYNLVGNAIKFTEQGWVKVSVSAAVTDTSEMSKVYLTLKVKDTGIGISQDNLQHIFEQFYQVSQFNSNIRGTGLGLSITKRIVELMGGQIEVTSELGKGTEFCVTLPFQLVQQKVMPDPESSDTSVLKKISQDTRETIASNQELGVIKQQSEATKQPLLKVLLVEDNKVNQIVGEQFLIRLGCQVEIAENGLVAQQKFANAKHYDVIFMDCNMPEMDGFAATRAIRQIEQQNNLNATPIVALTAHVEEEVKRQCLQAGMNAFLSKPFLMAELQAIVEGISLGKPRL